MKVHSQNYKYPSLQHISVMLDASLQYSNNCLVVAAVRPLLFVNE